jgi:5,10-methylene-tetrahydrofolate dehydrogenase/methenyl tetrahydrofolate cyclohydrolase
MTTVLDSQGIAQTYLDWARDEAKKFAFTPRLATILFKPTADPASVQYRDLIGKDAKRVGVGVEAVEASSEAELKTAIDRLNKNESVHGIIVLYPLRCKLPDEDVMDLVSPYKDAEGLHSINLGYLVKYKIYLDAENQAKCVVPATAKAAVKALLSRPEVPLKGAFVTIVNNSMRVGKPLGLMLENLGATVVKCYHLTKPADLERSVRSADVLVTAVPDPSFRIDPSWVKQGAAVLDLSYEGNIDTAPLVGRAKLVTMPENRLGRVTRAMMFVNLIYCAKYKGLFY